jgi:hypothetical protein
MWHKSQKAPRKSRRDKLRCVEHNLHDQCSSALIIYEIDAQYDQNNISCTFNLRKIETVKYRSWMSIYFKDQRTGSVHPALWKWVSECIHNWECQILIYTLCSVLMHIPSNCGDYGNDLRKIRLLSKAAQSGSGGSRSHPRSSSDGEMELILTEKKMWMQKNERKILKMLEI